MAQKANQEGGRESVCTEAQWEGAAEGRGTCSDQSSHGKPVREKREKERKRTVVKCGTGLQ